MPTTLMSDSRQSGTVLCRMLRRMCVGWLVVVCFLTSGCVGARRSIDDARGAFYRGDLEAAREILAGVAESGDRYAAAAALDLATVELAQGDVQSAQQRLRSLRDRFDQAPGFSALHETAALVSDDTARLYQPAGYEAVMIRTMLALCSLANGDGDAESYALQATMKQAELARQAEERGMVGAAEIYQPIAIAPYLRGIMREATHHDYEDAAKAYQLVSSIQPTFAPAMADITRAGGGVHSPPGHGVLYLVAMVGRGPVLRETTAEATSTALSIASTVWNAGTNRSRDGKGDVVLPNIARVKVPQVTIPSSHVAAVEVLMNQRPLGTSQTLTDVGGLAMKQTEAEMPWTIARAVLRRATKELAVAKTTEVLGLHGGVGSLFHFAAASSWSGLESADTRCWGLLPREIQVCRCELPVGEHALELRPVNRSGLPIGPSSRVMVSMRDGQNHYLISFAAGDQPPLVVSAGTGG